MHKKSLEAATKMKEEEEKEEDEDKKHENSDVRTESIAALRARAQHHSSKMLHVLNKGEDRDRTNDNSSSDYGGQFMAPNN